MQFKSNLKVWLSALLQNSISETELTKMVHFCRAISESYLTQRRSGLVHICSLNGLTVSDLAYDCIAQAFARDDDGRFDRFERFVASLDQSLEKTAEHSLFLAFKSFILRIVKTQLSKIYAQSDPVGAKIHRNVKDCVRISELVDLSEDFRGYVLQPAASDPLEHLSAYPTDQLRRELLARAPNASTTGGLLEALAAILAEQAEYRRSIRLIDVVQIFKSFYGQFSELVTDEEHPFDLNGLSQIDLEVIQREVRQAVQEKIIATYLLPGKVSKSEATALDKVMSEMIADWCEVQADQGSLWQYAQRYLAISESDYQSVWRTKIEYLTRIAKEKFAACLAENI